ncbi:hypothetical protein EDF63_1851 [Curtobacterium sp. JUb34]|uniref:polymer-forming cytoskeletal protein n=1 Tax=Curtobacterium sp. JUb34 TaxID=2485109 RepID=UPI000F460934|nr:polymer-forming cytoskeletal protein [Curtobacterium sp. JUb34]ROR33437.1 hypothetical protein EDF63_1851 [Curtobacterium sp. JUb34]
MTTRSTTARVLVTLTAAGLLVAGSGGVALAMTGSDGASFAGSDPGPRFYSGSDIDITTDVDGDVYATGRVVTIRGDVRGDVIVAAQTIVVSGSVDGDVRLAGQDVSVSGDVSRSGTIAAAELTVPAAGSFGDDVVASAGAVRIAGDVGRHLRLNVGGLSISGNVGGDVSYVSDQEASIRTGAVAGTVERSEPSSSDDTPARPAATFLAWLVGLLAALVALSLITSATALLVPRVLREVTDQLYPTPWRALLVGFVASLAVPAGILVLLVTLVGAPLALAVLVVWSVLCIASFPYGAHYVGRVVFRDRRGAVVTSLVGGAILVVALHVPFLNIAVWVLVVLLGTGAQLLAFARRRPWRAPATGGPPESSTGDGAPLTGATRIPVATTRAGESGTDATT